MRIRSISPRICSSCVTISLGQGLYDLTEDSSHWAAFPLEKSQTVPQADEFSLCRGVHRPNVNEKRTNCKPLQIGAA
jgi:hypothetical protein